MSLVYLAGPIAGCSDDEANGWRTHAKSILGEDRCLDPMDRDMRGVEILDYKYIVDNDKLDILEADVVLVYAWKHGVGTPMEVFFAHTLGKTVIVVLPPHMSVSPWYRYHATTIYRNIDNAIWAVKRIIDEED